MKKGQCITDDRFEIEKKNGLGQKKRTEEEERQKRNRLYVEGKNEAKKK